MCAVPAAAHSDIILWEEEGKCDEATAISPPVGRGRGDATIIPAQKSAVEAGFARGGVEGIV
ncbi:MAG: hypothetical protein LBL82_07275 [Oscillospiraceae bacterium]|jgi:hypothetical protein|nr:hypothetical protein [Oscillospiraceae bacterium]